jgi:hypothetical protein
MYDLGRSDGRFSAERRVAAVRDDESHDGAAIVTTRARARPYMRDCARARARTYMRDCARAHVPASKGLVPMGFGCSSACDSSALQCAKSYAGMIVFACLCVCVCVWRGLRDGMGWCGVGRHGMGRGAVGCIPARDSFGRSYALRRPLPPLNRQRSTDRPISVLIIIAIDQYRYSAYQYPSLRLSTPLLRLSVPFLRLSVLVIIAIDQYRYIFCVLVLLIPLINTLIALVDTLIALISTVFALIGTRYNRD